MGVRMFSCLAVWLFGCFKNTTKTRKHNFGVDNTTKSIFGC